MAGTGSEKGGLECARHCRVQLLVLEIEMMQMSMVGTDPENG